MLDGVALHFRGYIYFSSVFPQCMFYIWGYLLIGCWCLNRDKSGTQMTFAQKRLEIIFIAFVVIILGIYVESAFSLKIFSVILDV